jgi:thioredoxin reductase (NADPH)
MGESMKEQIHDVIMIGAGPSSLAAALYTTREELETLLIEKGAIGGLAAITDTVDNYPGFPEGIEGMKLAGLLEQQAKRFGAKIEFGEVSSVRDEGDVKVVVSDGKELKAKTVLIATGSDYRKINVPGEAEYFGRGVHYCATCDGAFYKDKRVVVIGGGNSAVQESLFLTRFVKHIDIVTLYDITASGILKKELQENISKGKITVHANTTTKEIVATDGKVSGVKIEEDGKESLLKTDGVFIFIGLIPNTQFLNGSGVELDEHKLIKTDEKLQTSVPGIFASGDVRSGATLQIASAVGEGATAALSIREYLDEKAR